jgi:hypothetical protein
MQVIVQAYNMQANNDWNPQAHDMKANNEALNTRTNSNANK